MSEDKVNTSGRESASGQKNNKNLNGIFIFSVIFLLLILAGLFCVFNKVLNEKVKKNEAENIVMEDRDLSAEAEKIRQANEEIINNVSNNEGLKVKAISKSDHLEGDVNAPVKLIVYDDLDNEFSFNYNNYLKEAKKYFAGKIVIAYRHFPMRSHSNSLAAAMASECAGEQGKFLEMRELILSGKEAGKAGNDDFSEKAKNLELDIEKFENCLIEEKYKEKIQKDVNEAEQLSVIGAPTTFLNERTLPGAYQFEDFVDSANIERKGLKSLIEEEL